MRSDEEWTNKSTDKTDSLGFYVKLRVVRMVREGGGMSRAWPECGFLLAALV